MLSVSSGQCRPCCSRLPSGTITTLSALSMLSMSVHLSSPYFMDWLCALRTYQRAAGDGFHFTTHTPVKSIVKSIQPKSPHHVTVDEVACKFKSDCRHAAQARESHAQGALAPP